MTDQAPSRHDGWKTWLTVTAIAVLLPAPLFAADDPITDGKVDIGGRALAVHCEGDGSPTVIIEAGLGDPGESWADLQPRIAELTRVCRYARAGLGESDPPPEGPRTVDHVVEELERLLDSARLDGPYVLVGHSLGGVNARRFTARNPGKVAGLLLVDSSHEEQVTLSKARMPEALKELEAAFRKAKDRLPKPEGIDPEFYVPEGRRPDPLGDVPLVVLTSGKDPSLPPPEAMPEEMREVMERSGDAIAEAWKGSAVMIRHLQHDLVYLSTNSRQVVVDGAGHFIHVDRPEVVLDAIRELVESARRVASRARAGLE